jgi:hypothetical protein
MTECCVPPQLILPPQAERLLHTGEAFRLEWLTIGWMTVEAVFAGVRQYCLIFLDLKVYFASPTYHMDEETLPRRKDLYG